MDIKFQLINYSLSDNSCVDAQAACRRHRSPGIDEDESEDEFSAFTDSLCRPIACIGCRNYHGLEYNGEKLICAFHLSGWDDDENCPDFLPVDTNEMPI